MRCPRFEVVGEDSLVWELKHDDDEVDHAIEKLNKFLGIIIEESLLKLCDLVIADILQ